MLSVVSLLALSACSNDDSDTLTRVPLTIKATIQGAETRVAYNDDGSGSFTEGDAIYVSKLVDGSVNKSDYVNVKYVYKDGDFEPENSSGIYLGPDDGTVSFVAYNVELTPDSRVNDYLDITTYSNDNQTSSLAKDVLGTSSSCSARNPVLTLNMEHKMCKITLIFSSVITQCALSTDHSDYDLITKAALTDVGFSEINRGNVLCNLTSTDASTTATALMFPDNVTSDIKVDIVYNGKNYSGILGSVTWSSNTHYIYNIKISDVLTVDSGTSITGFEDSGTTFEAEQN
jgi:hypothetical protein